MDFISKTFPDTKTHIALFKLTQLQNKDATTVEFPDKASERSASLAKVFNAHKSHLALINVQYVISLMHLNIAISRALVNRRDGKLMSKDFGSEIIYHCYPGHRIDNAIESFGLKNCQNAFFAVFVDMDESLIAEIKRELTLASTEELTDLNRHLEW